MDDIDEEEDAIDDIRNKDGGTMMKMGHNFAKLFRPVQ